MTNPELSNNPRANAEHILRSSQAVLRRAVAAVYPESPDADPLQVFPAPGEVRAEDEGLNLNDLQAAELRKAAAELGFGRMENRNLSEQGLIGANVIIEGGQPHKMQAEAVLVAEDTGAQPKRIFIAGSPHRKLTNQAEIESAERIFGEAGETEYDTARQVAQSLPGFHPEEYDLPFGYDIQNNYTVTNQATGQLKMIGWSGNTPVILLKVDRENYIEGDQQKYRNQPGTADLVGVVDAVQKQEDDPTTPIALVTSATYEPSRLVDCVRASLVHNRTVGVAAYGSNCLAAIKGEDLPAPAPLNQLPGELHKLAQQVVKLEATLKQS